MSRLVAYASSDEDDGLEETPTVQVSWQCETVIVSLRSPSLHQESAPAVDAKVAALLDPSGEASLAPTSLEAKTIASEPPAEPQLGPEVGPEVGPSLPPPDGATLAEERYPSAEAEADADASRQDLSPYTTERNLVHSLTLPSVADTDVPPSPPGSPPPGLAALNKKFDAFLALKRRQGTHFNARLQASTAARNPAMMDKLLRFVGMETDVPPPAAHWVPPPVPAPAAGGEAEGETRAGGEQQQEGGETVWAGAAQYATTLPAELWDPAAFPGWAFKDALRKAQEKGQKERARKQGESVDFVPAGNGFVSATASRSGSQAGTPGMSASAGPATGKRKSRFDK
jgi:hypothetical protein